MESKPHERIDLLIIASEYLPDKKKSIPTVMKTCFSHGKLMKQFGNPLSKRILPFQLTPYF